jgi:2-amino-4-hydroxy-6-hydroxymethyldihydropteridine diphosphokinase
MPIVFIGIGSNLGDRRAHLLRAIEELRAVGRVTAISTIRETQPVNVSEDQPDFLNAAVAVETEEEPRAVLGRLLQIEAEMGRVRTGKGMAREIDLDLLAYDDKVVTEPALTLPHPRMHLRRFVLEPLCEVAPTWRHPVAKRTVEELLRELATD